jgi:hypothetical protein
MIIALALSVAVGFSSDLHAGTERRVDGALHIQNTATPADGKQTLVLEEMWRAGGDDDSDEFFGLVTRVMSDGDGRIYLLDPQLKQVHVYSPDGDVLAPLFREGEGPGEVEYVRDACLMPDGSVAAFQLSRRSLVKVHPDGTPAGNVILANTGAGFMMPTSAVAGGEQLVLTIEEANQGAKPGAGTRNSVLAAFAADGTEQVRYVEDRREYDYNNMVFREVENFPGFMWSYAVGPDGRVYAPAERDVYAISVFNADGSVDRVIEREFEPLERSARSARRMRELAERRFRTAPFEVEYHFEETEPVVAWYHRGLQVDGEGRLWVRNARSGIDQPDGVMLTLDVFDAAGHYVNQVSFACDGDGTYDGFFLLGNDRVLVVKSFVDSMRDWFGGGRGPISQGEDAEEPGPVEIICYRVNGGLQL